MSSDERHEKMQDTENPSPPNKMLQRPDSLENKYSDSTDSNVKDVHIHRVRERDSGTSITLHKIIHTTIVLIIVQITFF